MLLRQSRALNAALIVLDIAFFGENIKPVSASQIAQRTNISRRSIEPILQALAKAHILKSIRGPHGGYLLEEGEVTLRAVIEPVLQKGSKKKNNTQHGALYTDVLLPKWRECDKKILEWMDDVTISELIKRARALGIRPAQQYPLTFSI